MAHLAAVLSGALALACIPACCEEDPDDPDHCDEKRFTPDEATRNALATLDIQLRQLELRAGQYATSMDGANDASCISIHRSYNVDARAQVFNMTQVESDLDAAIVSHGGDAYADIACSIDALVTELDYHEAVACQDATIELDRAEATRHLAALTTLRDRLVARSAEIATGLDSGAATWMFAAASSCP